MPLVETRGPKVGRCNICGTDGPLTEDHTPPKGCVRPTTVELHHIHARLQPERVKGRISQNGVKFRTLCGRCNSHFLGAEYDPTLIKFAQDVALVLRQDILLPTTVAIRTKPQRLMRSVIGHVWAQGVNAYFAEARDLPR